MEQQVPFAIITENDQNILNSGKAFNPYSFETVIASAFQFQILKGTGPG